MAFSLFSISVDGMLGKEDLVIPSNLSQLIAENLGKPFHTYVDESTYGSKLWLRGSTAARSTDIPFPVPCGTGIRIGIQDWASDWSNKLCARIISRAQLRNYFSTNVPPPSPLSSTHCACVVIDCGPETY